MNKKMHLIMAALTMISMSFNGCYYEAEDNYSVPAEESCYIEKDTERNEQKEATEQLDERIESTETAITYEKAVSFFSQYTTNVLYPDQQCHVYFCFGENEKDGVSDLWITVHDLEIGNQTLKPEFDFFDEEDREYFKCEENEVLIYYTINVEAGDHHNVEPIGGDTWFGGIKLCCVEDINGILKPRVLMRSKHLFYPMENYGSEEGAHFIHIEPGNNRTFLYVEKIKTEDLNKPLFLLVNIPNFNLFDEGGETPDSLTNTAKGQIAFYQMNSKG